MTEHRSTKMELVVRGRHFLCRVDVELDIDAILRLMGERCSHNKSERSYMLGGMIKGRIQPLRQSKDDKTTDESAAGS